MIGAECDLVECERAAVQGEGVLGVDLESVNAEASGAGQRNRFTEFGGDGCGVGRRNVTNIERATGDVELFADVELANVLRTGCQCDRNVVVRLIEDDSIDCIRHARGGQRG